jgi:regulator of ribonuclease activity A
MADEPRPIPALPTADLADKHIGSLDDVLSQQQQQQQSTSPPSPSPPPPPRAVPRGAFASFGPQTCFAGRAHVVACFRSNAAVRAALETPGRGRVLVVKVCDPLALKRCAFLGDNLAALLVANGWAGAVVAGNVRDAAAMRALPGLGVVALGSCPLKSGRTPDDPGASASEAAEGVDLRAAGDGAAAGAAGWAVVREGDVLYVDGDGFVISDRILVA